jgi:flagellar motor switch protein FliN/FliY
MSRDKDKDIDAIHAANQATIGEWKSFLDLLVPLSIELGRTKLTAREILNLEETAVIQLMRSTGEGVDILSDNARLARGEILMIEDRTGIRINEVFEQKD